MVKISVTVPAFNESEGILDVLECFNAQSSRDFEVIVVDNNSTDTTAVVVEGFTKRATYPLKVIEEKLPGVGHARKRGAEDALSRGVGLLAGTDADCEVDPQWIAGILDVFQREDVAVISGKYVHSLGKLKGIIASLPADVQQKLLDLFELNNLMVEHTLRLPLLTGSNFAMRAEAYRTAGGFVQPYKEGKIAPQEDWNLGEKLQTLGYTTVFAKTENPSDPRRILQWLVSERDVIYEQTLTHVRQEDFLEKLVHVSDERMLLRLRKVLLFHLVSPVIKKMAPPEDAAWFLGDRLNAFVADIRASGVLTSEDPTYRAKVREDLLDAYTTYIIGHISAGTKIAFP